MHLRSVHKGSVWAVMAMANGDATASDGETNKYQCDLLQFLQGADEDIRQGRAKFLKLVKGFADQDRGPQSLKKETCHDVFSKIVEGQRCQIWQLRAAHLRVLFFYDANHVIVCSHGFIKHTNKTPESEINQAIEAWKLYQAGKKPTPAPPRRKS